MSKRPILFVDDERSVLDSFEFLFEDVFEVLTAQTVEEAFRIFREREIPVVVADYKMDSVNGIEFLKEVQRRHPETMRVLLTAYTSSSLLVEAINEAHVWGFIQKPFEREKDLVFHILDRVLKVYDLRVELKHAKAKLEEYSHNLEQLVEERTKQLVESERMATLGRMLSKIAHDLRSSVATLLSLPRMLRGNFEQLRDRLKEKGDDLYPDAEENLGFFDEATEVLRQVLEGLHGYGKSVESWGEVDVREGIGKVLGIFRRQWKGRIEVQEHHGLLPKVWAQGAALSRVWLNLLSNAAQALEPQAKEGKGRIEIETSSDQGHVEVKIRDNGPGIPADRVSRLFDLFYTTKGEGMGLGLTIAHEIVERHRGTIQVNSEVNRGTEFVVRIPVGGEGKG